MIIYQKTTDPSIFFFKSFSKASESKYEAYREVSQARDMELSHSLLEDLKICGEDDISLLCFLAADIFHKFADESRNNSQLIHLYVSSIDSSQLYQLIVQCSQGSLVLFEKNQTLVELLRKSHHQFYQEFLNNALFNFILVSSLNWETIEQIFFWQLVTAHILPLQLLLSILPKLKANQDYEALAALLGMIRHERYENVCHSFVYFYSS